MKTEAVYQAELIKRIKALLPGCIILKNDAGLRQGVPDLIVLYKRRWACLEVKRSAKSSERPNQRYYVEQWNELSFAAFVYPENEEEVLNALQQALRPSRKALVSQSKQERVDRIRRGQAGVGLQQGDDSSARNTAA